MDEELKNTIGYNATRDLSQLTLEQRIKRLEIDLEWKSNMIAALVDIVCQSLTLDERNRVYDKLEDVYQHSMNNLKINH